MSVINESYRRNIKDKALELGFSAVGFAKAEALPEAATHLKDWLAAGHQAEMAYMNKHFEKRTDPTLLVEGAKTIISVLLNYTPSQKQTHADAPKLARYAYGRDYHFTLKDKLKQLYNHIRETIYPALEGRFFVDSAPVLDRAWAARSGLGWIGKNTNLIHKKLGSYVFIGELIINLELAPDAPIKEACGGCQRCIDACPTNALIGPYQLDAKRCISYLTIENKGPIPSDYQNQFNNWVFGCDICQEVCPWNWKARPHKEPDFTPHSGILELTNDEWHQMSEDTFHQIFKHSAVKRTKYLGLKRNLQFLKGNF
jgi:epoxyqueuosine reductase